MAPLLAVLLLAPQDVPDRVHAILHRVEYDALDARQAFRDLGRRGLIGIVVAPDIQGPVTLDLQNVEWEVALQNVTRQVDATYRFERGWLYVVRRREEDSTGVPVDPDPEATKVVRAYERLRRAIAAGDGRSVRSVVLPGFQMRDAGKPSRVDWRSSPGGEGQG